MSRTPDDLERLLHRARPAPREEFVRELERSLPAPRTARERGRLRIVAAGWGLAGTLALGGLGLSLVGLLPFTSGGSPARAEPDCKTVTVERDERRPYFARAEDGTVEVRYRVQRVPRLVRRCP